MDPIARYHDGVVALARDVTFAITRDLEKPELIIADQASREVLDRWSLPEVFEVPARKGELLLGATNRPTGARLRMVGKGQIEATRQLLPGLTGHRRRNFGGQLRIIGVATAALVSVVLAYLLGVPLLASQIVPLVPPEWEAQVGETALNQISQLVGEMEACDPDPHSLANRAIDRFAREVMAQSGSPFTPHITVVRGDIRNAFALPGGQAFYFSALLEKTSSPDEFAGVMAHELGHVHYRHGMEALVANSATGLLVGFVLGDMTGLSVAGGLGAAMLDTRFSRDAERQADAFAGKAGQALGFDPKALADLIERVAGDNATSQIFQILSSHPLTAERRAMLEQLPGPLGGRRVFSAEEWSAIQTMCQPSQEDFNDEELDSSM